MFTEDKITEVIDVANKLATSTVSSVDVPSLLTKVSEHLGYGANFAWDTLVLQFRLLGIAELFALTLTTIGCIAMVVYLNKKLKAKEEVNPFTILFIAMIVSGGSYLTITYAPQALTKALNPEYHAITEIAKLTSEYVR